jgi:uncharacterized protein YueI
MTTRAWEDRDFYGTPAERVIADLRKRAEAAEARAERAERERDAAREEIRRLKQKLRIVTDPDLDCEIGTPTPSERESTPRQQDKGEPG